MISNYLQQTAIELDGEHVYFPSVKSISFSYGMSNVTDDPGKCRPFRRNFNLWYSQVFFWVPSMINDSMSLVLK